MTSASGRHPLKFVGKRSNPPLPGSVQVGTIIKLELQGASRTETLLHANRFGEEAIVATSDMCGEALEIGLGVL